MALLGFTLPPDSGEKLTLGKWCYNPAAGCPDANLFPIILTDEMLLLLTCTFSTFSSLL
jgi:hypothetical protein